MAKKLNCPSESFLVPRQHRIKAIQELYNAVNEVSSSDIVGKADKIPVVEHGTSDTTLTLPPNQFHIWGEVASLTLTLGTPEEGVYNEYMFEFVSGATATTLSLPSTIKWQDDLDVEANMRYQVSIVNNIGLIVGVETV